MFEVGSKVEETVDQNGMPPTGDTVSLKPWFLVRKEEEGVLPDENPLSIVAPAPQPPPPPQQGHKDLTGDLKRPVDALNANAMETKDVPISQASENFVNGFTTTLYSVDMKTNLKRSGNEP